MMVGSRWTLMVTGMSVAWKRLQKNKIINDKIQTISQRGKKT